MCKIVANAYWPIVFVYEFLLMGVNPDPAKVTWPVPCWTTMQLNPSGKPVGIVKVTAVALVKLMTVPLSDAVKV
jgi:hypothetical protein